MAKECKCPIWGTPAKEYKLPNGIYKVNSPRAGGLYEITFEAIEDLPAMAGSMEEKRKLTYEIIKYAIASSTLRVTTTVLEVVSHRKIPKPEERAETLLHKLIRDTKHLGQKLEYERSKGDVVYGDTMYVDKNGTFGPLMAWSCSKNLDEVLFILRFLEEKDYVSCDDKTSSMTSCRIDVVVRPEGFAYISDQDSIPSISHQAFIAMWFDESLDEAYEKGFDLAIRQSGYEPLRIDRKEHINKIDDEIIAEIRRSRFVVADFTSDPENPRGGVYFEAGFALGLKIPVIWTCRKDMINHVHFDTRQFNHIVWADADDLCTKLKNRIGAVIV